MVPETRWSIEAPWMQRRLRVFEPTLTEVRAAAPLLALFYNDRHNAAMLTNTHALTAAEVVETYQELRAAGGRPFLLEQDGALIGDADFRKIGGGAAEFAMLIGPRAQQSRGLGTRYAAMLHVAAWRAFGFERVYAAIIPTNIASRRVLEKLGYQVDQSPRAAFFSEAGDDIVMSLDRLQFEQRHGALFSQAVITALAPASE